MTRAFFIQKQVCCQIFGPKKIFLALLRLFYFSSPFFCNVCCQRLRSIEKNFWKYIIDVLKESIPGIRLAIRGFPNLKMPKNRFFFIVRYIIRRIFLIFFYACKNLCFQSIFKPQQYIWCVYTFFRPAKCKKKIKNAFFNFWISR